nr:thylakoid lumenal 19 kDa protein, chloroplastic [Ipomoea batatas]
MATIFSPSSVFSGSTAKPPPPQQQAKPPQVYIPPPSKSPLANITTAITATALATAILTAAPPTLAESPAFSVYYGTAASAANYGGYGGNSDKKATAEYIYDVPDGWKERLLAPKEVVLNNLALSDVDLQDLIASADGGVKSEERKDEHGQVYYEYEIDGAAAHSLISVTCAKNKLYAHFVNAPLPEWNRDQDTLRHIHQSFKTVGLNKLKISPVHVLLHVGRGFIILFPRHGGVGVGVAEGLNVVLEGSLVLEIRAADAKPNLAAVLLVGAPVALDGEGLAAFAAHEGLGSVLALVVGLQGSEVLQGAGAGVVDVVLAPWGAAETWQP